MGADRWSAESDPAVLGAVVHGPAVIARSTGIAMAARCVFAHPGGLELHLVLRASGVQAEAAGRQTFGRHSPRLAGGEDDAPWDGGSEPHLLVEVDGKRATAYPQDQSASGGQDEFTAEQRVVVPALPADGRLGLTVSWPQAGLAEGGVVLVLDPLDDLESRVVRLPS